MRLALLLSAAAVAAAAASTERAGFGAIAKRHTASEELLDLRGAGSGFSNVSSELIPPRRPPADKDKCPPCFNCLLPAFNCGQFGECNQYDGQCRCPPGFGGQDCLTPLCGSLKDGDARFPRPDGKLCDCNDGWGGINCNVCKDDSACKGFKLRNPIDGLDAAPADGDGDDDDPSQQMVCYKGGLTVDRSFQMCDVTNRKIIDTIPDQKKPQVTFSCIAAEPATNVSAAVNFGDLGRGFGGVSTLEDKESMGTCGFQFWVDRIESFYCKLEQCQWYAEETPGANETHFNCEKIECACIPGRFLCGENGSVNIDDFLSEEVKGPGSFNCVAGQGCTFEEPAMNQLINDIFGDKAITLDCDSGECLHYSQVPGYSPPAQADNSFLVALSAALALAIFAAACLLLWYLGRARRNPPGFAGVKLPEDEAAKLMADHVPATLHFSNISYTLPKGRQVLSHVTGTVRPGEILAIMGASGAGKSTLLDILARKAKRGKVEGVTYVNGRQIDNAVFRRVSGFVDQEDTLLPTLTVYETVLYSALLRLPRDMSYEAKVYRTLETMNELGILGIKDSRIGESGKRSISGGEKRRVSIACELVTGPSILFLDEPTSGLDSYNAYNVIDSLKTLAKQYRRTVIFTIHQPQSNIVALFDRLLVLARGQLVYSGEAAKAQEHFEGIGYVCPAGYNIADYLIDVTVEAAGDSRRGNGNGNNGGTDGAAGSSAVQVEGDAEAGFASRTRSPPDTGTSTPLPTAIQNKAARILGLTAPGASGWSTAGVALDAAGVPQVPEALAALVVANRAGDATKIVEAEITRIQSGETPDGEERDVEDEFAELHIKGYKKASFGTQFVLLSGRAFKNLYRNPLLMGTHYLVAIVVALLCGFFFYHVTNDIPGFQNRLGLFLFILSLFGFSTLSSLGIFASERMLFMRERANGYYSPAAYFLSKVLFDIIPLRVIPPFVLGSIVYGLAGLNPDVASFWKFILILVLFNLSAAAIVLFLSVAVADSGVANLLGSLVMLYNLLFAGLLMNYDRVPHGLKWMQTLSFFHAAYEALLVNELRYLQLIEHKFGLDIQVPSATILSSFGFHAQAFWFPDTTLLVVVFGVFITASYVVLEVFVKERR
ncbi:FAD-dependent urate hydroxylase [Vanrija albida]|uniref:FAD-dependent urate hydroxylase n=1 Tax=Vanrija albida TaxID=181172 RepID=A0ABR3Q128_9TREE